MRVRFMRVKRAHADPVMHDGSRRPTQATQRRSNARPLTSAKPEVSDVARVLTRPLRQPRTRVVVPRASRDIVLRWVAVCRAVQSQLTTRFLTGG